MTILEALKAITIYPIPDNAVEQICVERGLDYTTDYDLSVGQSEAFQLAKADCYLWLYTSQSVKEQEISFTIQERDNFLYMANLIYQKFDDEKFNGRVYGFVGEDYNG